MLMNCNSYQCLQMMKYLFMCIHESYYKALPTYYLLLTRTFTCFLFQSLSFQVGWCFPLSLLASSKTISGLFEFDNKTHAVEVLTVLNHHQIRIPSKYCVLLRRECLLRWRKSRARDDERMPEREWVTRLDTNLCQHHMCARDCSPRKPMPTPLSLFKWHLRDI